MPTDLHFICRHGRSHRKVGQQIYETGNWAVSPEVAEQAIGGRVYLHERQDEAAWHGGTITAWRHAEENSERVRVVFTYVVDQPFRVKCKEGWGQEKAIIRR